MFKVECKYDHKDLYLSITHNEYQWTSIPIKNPEREIPLIIDALQSHLTNHSSRTARACPFCDCIAISPIGRCEGCGKFIKPPPA